MRTSIYARVSSKGQADRGTIASQVEALEEKVAAAGDELVVRFIDDGYSGARLDRPGLDALRDQAEAGVFERVWCLSPDRLARNFAYQMLVLDELARLSVEVCFIDSPPIDDDPQARLLVQVQGVIAEYEKSKIAERQRRGKLFKVRAGEAIFHKVPFGYRRVPHSEAGAARLEIYEPEAAIVRRIFDDYVAGGHSMRQIAKRLYADGILSPTGKAVWAGSTLGPLMRNSSYAGTAYWYRHETMPATRPGGRPSRRVRPKEDWIPGAVPAIVSTEAFEAAQRIAKENSAFSPRRAPSDRWLLRGLVVCGPCGIRCNCLQTPTTRDKESRNRYYRCAYFDPLKAGGPDRRCRQRQIRADELDAFVFDQIRDAMARPELLTIGEAAVATRQPTPDDELLASELTRLDRRVAAAQAERRRLVDCYQAGLLELTELTRRGNDLQAREARLSAERSELVAERSELASNNLLRDRVGDFAARVGDGMNALDFEGRQRLMRLVVEQVRVNGWQVEIRLRIPLDEPDPRTSTNARPRSRRNGQRRPRRADDGVSSKDGLRSVGAVEPFLLAPPFWGIGLGVDEADAEHAAGPRQPRIGKRGAVVSVVPTSAQR